MLNEYECTKATKYSAVAIAYDLLAKSNRFPFVWPVQFVHLPSHFRMLTMRFVSMFCWHIALLFFVWITVNLFLDYYESISLIDFTIVRQHKHTHRQTQIHNSIYWLHIKAEMSWSAFEDIIKAVDIFDDQSRARRICHYTTKAKINKRNDANLIQLVCFRKKRKSIARNTRARKKRQYFAGKVYIFNEIPKIEKSLIR